MPAGSATIGCRTEQEPRLWTRHRLASILRDAKSLVGVDGVGRLDQPLPESYPRPGPVRSCLRPWASPATLGVNPRPVLATTRWIPGDDGSVVRAAVSLESGGTLDSRFLPF
jgi:hypothetical protein